MSAGLLTLCWLTLAPAGPPSDVYTMRDRHLQIPIRVNDARRGDLVELVLYVSTDQGRTWTGAGKAKPMQDAFNFHADKDGLYWFSVQAVDRDGKYDPPDIAQVAPALKVLIDTQKPLVQLLGAERVGDEVVVSWQTLDTQADINTLKLEYRANDGSSPFWQLAPVTPALSGQVRFKPGTTSGLTVRLQMADQAGVLGTATKEVPAGPAAAVVQQTNSVAPPPNIPPSSLTQPPSGIGGTVPLMEQAPLAAPPVPAPTAPVIPPTPSVTANEGPSSLAPLPGVRPGEELPRKPNTAPPEFGAPAATAARGGLPEIQHVRDRQVGLEFEIDRKGPSGVKKIETYITQDDGQTWFRYGETTDTNSPLQVVLPEKEGVYGFHVVAYSGVMQSEGPPKNGTPPDVRLHVDRTAPVVEWYPPVPDANMPNALTLRFSVQDPNLAPNSIVLEWSRQPNSGWQTISPSNLRPATIPGLPNLKECTWLLPTDVPDAVFLRLTARDLAGNIGERITRDAVTVDLQKPTARVKRVVTAATTTQFRPQ
jgi:hypothetical protein